MQAGSPVLSPPGLMLSVHSSLPCRQSTACARRGTTAEACRHWPSTASCRLPSGRLHSRTSYVDGEVYAKCIKIITTEEVTTQHFAGNGYGFPHHGSFKACVRFIFLFTLRYYTPLKRSVRCIPYRSDYRDKFPRRSFVQKPYPNTSAVYSFEKDRVEVLHVS